MNSVRYNRGSSKRAILLLLCFLIVAGIGFYACHQKSHKEPPLHDKPWKVPVEPAIARATEETESLVYGGLPKHLGDQQLTIIGNIGFYAGYCEGRRNPLWVAYRVDEEVRYEGLSRPTHFTVDHRTESKISSARYSNSGYDRGHLAPNSAIATRFGRDAQLETFLMSNVTPQTPELNRRIWARLEALEREYAEIVGPMWVITGPIFGEEVKQIDNMIDIPEAFYKILIKEVNDLIKAKSFIIPQPVAGDEPLGDYLVSIDEIEKRTGLIFFEPMSEEYARRFQSHIAQSTWCETLQDVKN